MLWKKKVDHPAVPSLMLKTTCRRSGFLMHVEAKFILGTARNPTFIVTFYYNSQKSARLESGYRESIKNAFAEVYDTCVNLITTMLKTGAVFYHGHSTTNKMVKRSIITESAMNKKKQKRMRFFFNKRPINLRAQVDASA